MSKKRVPMCLRQPDQVLLVYGKKVIPVDMGDFESYMVAVDADKADELRPYLAGKKE